VSDAPGTVLSYFGYVFEVPWNASFKQKLGKGIVQLEFQSGQNVTFIVPANQGGLLTEIVQDESMHMKNLQVVFGDLMNRSAYDQYEAQSQQFVAQSQQAKQETATPYERINAKLGMAVGPGGPGASDPQLAAQLPSAQFLEFTDTNGLQTTIGVNASNVPFMFAQFDPNAPQVQKTASPGASTKK